MFDCLFICLNYYFICLKPSPGWSYKFIYSWPIWECCHFELALSCSSLISRFYFKITLGISFFRFGLWFSFVFLLFRETPTVHWTGSGRRRRLKSDSSSVMILRSFVSFCTRVSFWGFQLSILFKWPLTIAIGCLAFLMCYLFEWGGFSFIHLTLKW